MHKPWNAGTLELWNPGTLERWNPGTLQPCNPGTLELLVPRYHSVHDYGDRAAHGQHGWCPRDKHQRVVGDLRRPVRIHQRDPWRDLGHLVASHDRPRHLLDARPPRDLSRRHRVGTDVRLARAAHYLRRLRRGARGGGPLLGISRAVWRVGLDLGRHRDDHV